MRIPVTAEQEKLVLDAYASAKTQRECSNYSGLSLGAVNAIIEKGRKNIGDIDDLRRFYVAISKRGLGAIDVQNLSAILDRLDALELTPNELSSAVEFLESTGYGNQTMKYMEAGMQAREVEKSTGMEIPKFLAWYKKATSQIEELKRQISNKEKQKDQLEADIRNLDELRNIKTKISAKGITIEKLDEFFDRQLQLEQLGFTPATARILANELARPGLSPETGALRLAKMLRDSATLESAIDSLQQQKSQLSSKVQELVDKRNQFDGEIGEKKKQLQDLETNILRKAQTEKEYLQKKRDEELVKIINEKKQLESEVADLERQKDDKRKELAQLEKRIEQHTDKLVMGQALIQLLKDPLSMPLVQLKTLGKYVEQALADRERFPSFTEGYLDQARDVMLKALQEYVSKDIVAGADYRRVVNEKKKLSETNSALQSELEKTMKALKDLDDAKRTITELQNTLTTVQKTSKMISEEKRMLEDQLRANGEEIRSLKSSIKEMNSKIRVLEEIKVTSEGKTLSEALKVLIDARKEEIERKAQELFKGSYAQWQEYEKPKEVKDMANETLKEIISKLNKPGEPFRAPIMIEISEAVSKILDNDVQTRLKRDIRPAIAQLSNAIRNNALQMLNGQYSLNCDKCGNLFEMSIEDNEVADLLRRDEVPGECPNLQCTDWGMRHIIKVNLRMLVQSRLALTSTSPRVRTPASEPSIF